MKNHILLAALFPLVFFTKTQAQALVPFLGANGKYGYSNEKGDLVFQPEYDDAPIMPADSFGVRVVKDRFPLYLLRNGIVLRGKDGYSKPLLNFTDPERRAAPDTLHDLMLAGVGGKVYFIHRTTRKVLDFWPNQYYTSPNWFPVYYRADGDTQTAFEFGFCRVYKGKGKVNFLNRNLKELFPRDFPAGTPLSDRYLLLADETQKMGIADSSGQIRIPFVWKRIQPAGRDGFFLVNNALHPTRHATAEKAGMIDADGKIVIDTVFRDLEPVGKNYVIARKKFTAGVMDYNGQWVIPMDYKEVRHLFDDFFSVESPGPASVNIINLKGEKQLPRNYNAVISQTTFREHRQFLELWDYPVVCIADSGFNIVFCDTNAQSRLVSSLSSDKFQFYTHKYVAGKPDGLHGVRDHTGRFVIPAEYDLISLPADDVDLYQVKKNGLWGLFDTEGREILPVKYASIRADESQSGKKVDTYWARLPEAKLYSAFGSKGEKLSLPDNFMPNRDRDMLAELVLNKTNDAQELALIDGSRVVWKDEYADIFGMHQVRTPEGGFFVDFGENIRVYNAFLKNIVPNGYAALRQFFDKKRLKNTGMMTLFQVQLGFTDNSQLPDDGDLLKMEQNIESHSVWPSLPADCSGSGVIDANGTWVSGPKAGVLFLPLSHHLVLEIGQKTGSHGQVFTLHRVNSPQKMSLSVSAPPGGMFDARNNFSMLIGRVSPTVDYAFFNEKGEQLTGIDIRNAGTYLRKRNLVTCLHKSGNLADVILDEKGAVLATLDENLDAASFFANPGDWPGDYFVAQRRDDGYSGVLDSTGKTVLPFKFRALKILCPGKLLSANNLNGHTELLNWQGEVIYTASENLRATCFEAANGYLLVSADHSTLVVSPEGSVVRTFPDKTAGLSGHPGYPNLAVLYDRNLKKNYWVDVVSGRVFRD